MPDTRKGILSTAAITAVGVGLVCVIVRNRLKILQRLKYAYDFRNPLRHKHIEIIETADDCQRVVATLKKCVEINNLFKNLQTLLSLDTAVSTESSDSTVNGLLWEGDEDPLPCYN